MQPIILYMNPFLKTVLKGLDVELKLLLSDHMGHLGVLVFLVVEVLALSLVER